MRQFKHEEPISNYSYLVIRSILITFILLTISQATNAAMPDPYNEQGLNIFRDDSSLQGYEHVDPFSGKLTLTNTDITIPGNGGLDLNVIRTHSSGNFASQPFDDPWSMHFGYVERSGDTSIANICTNNFVSNKTNPVLVLPDGSSQVLSDANSTTGYLFISKQHWKATCSLSGALGLIITSPEGTVYEMTYNASSLNEKRYYVSKITDKNGNWIAVTYATNTAVTNKPFIQTVTTSDGRALTYTYTSWPLGYKTLSTISDGGRIWTYTYTQLYTPGGQLNTGKFALTKVTRPDGLSWDYAYNTTGSLTGPNPAGYYSINTVKNPAGGTINYTYDFKDFYPVGLGSVRAEVITSKTLSGLGTTSYAYTPSTGAGILDTTVVTEPLRTITYKHYGYNTVAFQGETWKIGLLASKTIGTAQTESYTWTPLLITSKQNDARIFAYFNKLDTAVYAPLLATKVINRDGANFTTTYSGFDAYGNPSTVAETGSATRNLARTYNINTSKWILHQLKSETNTSFTTSYGFDANGNVTSENKFGVITSFGRTATGDISSITDARGKVKTLSNYYRGLPQAEAYPDTATLARTVTARGTIASITNSVGDITTYGYDILNRPTLINKPIGNDPTISWAATSRTVTSGNFQELTTYDAHYRPTKISRKDLTTGVVIATTLSYDALGRKTFESLPGSTTGTSYAYDILGRAKTITFADGTTNTYTYSGNSIVFKNERGLNYTYGYRIYGDPDSKELLSVAAPITSTNMSITRNAIGQPVSIVQNGVTRSYGYDAKGFMVTQTNPETDITSFGRDAVGNMISKKVGASGVTTYTYDAMNRVSTIAYPAPTPAVSFTYDKLGQVTASSSGAIVRSNTYDANRNLTSEKLTIDGLTYQATYTYNANNALSNITYPSGQNVAYSLDAFGRQTAATPYATAVSYHPSGQPSTFSLANGVAGNYTYQARYWPQSNLVAKGASTYISSAYAYDQNGNMNVVYDNLYPNYNRTLAFDGVDRLVAANGVWGTGTIAYDGQGNITSQQYGSFALTYHYDAATNRSIGATGSKAYAFTYDAYGNATGNGASNFEFDDASNMKCANCYMATRVDYLYDANNMRVKKLAGTTATYFLYGLNGSLLGEYTPASTTQKEYAYLGNKLLAEREQTAAQAPIISYYHTDAVGSPLAVTDAAGALKWREVYWPYGERNVRDAVATNETRWFAGKTQDKESGLSYFGARYYDPILGRFMGMDPVGVNENNIHSFNRYAYANNNPYRFNDPDGRCAALVETAVVVGGVYIVAVIARDVAKDLSNIILQNGSSNEKNDIVTSMMGTSTASSGGMLPPEDDNSSNSTSGPRDAKGVRQLTKENSTQFNGNAFNVKSDADLQNLYNRATVNGERITTTDSKIQSAYRLPDGTRVQMRADSNTGGRTINVDPIKGSGKNPFKIHIEPPK